MSIKEMKDIDIRTVNPQELVDVTTIAVDESLPKKEQIAENAVSRGMRHGR